MVLLETIQAFFQQSFVLLMVWIGGLFSITFRMFKLAKHKDEIMCKKDKKKLTDFLCRMANTTPGINPIWLSVFNTGLSDFFGPYHFSWSCLWRSVVISLSCFLVLWYSFVNNFSQLLLKELRDVFLVGVFVNLIGDYLSLAQTRYILNCQWSLWIRLIIDTLLTISLWILAANIGIVIIVAYSEGFDLEKIINFQCKFIGKIINTLFVNFNDFMTPLFWASFLTTFTTSIWLWLHALSAFTLRELSRFNELDLNQPNLAIAHVASRYLWGLGLVTFIFLELK